MPHASPGEVSVNAVLASRFPSLLFSPSIRLCAVTFVMKLKCMLHACRVFLLCLPLLTLRRLTIAASSDVASASGGHIYKEKRKLLRY